MTASSNASQSARERVFYADVVRAIAILMVVCSHAFADVCNLMNSYARSIWWVYNLLDSVIRLCVPFFIMVSGKFLLGPAREEPYLPFVWKRYSKVLGPFFGWSMIYAWFLTYVEQKPYSFVDSFLRFLQGPTIGHLYFMYIILGLYLLAPVLRAFVRMASRRDQAVLLSVWFGILTVQFFWPDWAGDGPGKTLIDYGGYFLLGYWLDQTDWARGKIGRLLALCASIVLFNAYATYRLLIANGGTMDERFYFGCAPLVAVYAASFFLVLKTLNYDAILPEGSRRRAGVTRLSLESFNIYLNHVLFLWLFAGGTLGFVLWRDTGGSALIGVPLLAASMLAASLVLSYLLKKIPYLSRLLVIP